MNNNQLITDWIRQITNESDTTLEWDVLTLRCDSKVQNGFGLKQGVWSQGIYPLTERALNWTVSMFARKFGKNTAFVAYRGGENESGVYGHFHALLGCSNNSDKSIVVETITNLWHRNLCRSLKANVESTVYQRPLNGLEAYSTYCQRYEGSTLNSGSAKVVMSRSLRL